MFNVFFALSISRVWAMIRVNAACNKYSMKWFSRGELTWEKEQDRPSFNKEDIGEKREEY